MKIKHLGQRYLSLLVALVMFVSLCPQALAADAVAEDESGTAKYTSISAAWSAAKSGKVIKMLQDWNLSDRLVLDDGESATIDMNGLRIDRRRSSYTSDGEVIYLDEGASLTLKSSVTTTEHTFTGWENGSRKNDLKIKSGGLVTGGWSSNGAGGIHINTSSMLTLDNVAVAGNCAEITFYQDGYGGGVMMDGAHCTLVMKNGAQIAYNEAQDEGGGVYANAKYAVIKMSDSSSIHHNRARDGGGGVYFSYGCFSLRSDDLTGSISNNTVTDGDGGAIFTEQCLLTENLGQIYGITMENNTCSGNGGAVYLHQEKTTINRCTIKQNEAKNGGGIYVNNDGNTLSKSTIESNKASSEGGGVFVSAACNISLSGTLYIRNNTRKSGTKDDLFLNDSAQTAYISGSPSGNSEIGVRTTKTSRNLNDTDDRKYFYEQAFFSDFDGYHIEFDGTSGVLKYVKGDPEPDPEFTTVKAGTVKKSGTYNGKDVIEGYFRYAAVLTTDVELTSNYYYSDGYFLNGSDSDAGDPTIYNEHLATMSMAMVLAGCCSNIGLNNEIKNQSQYNLDYTYKSQNIEMVLTDIGIASDDIYISETYATKPGVDTMDVAIGKKSLEDSDYTLVPVVVRSVGYESEWVSNFTLGDSGEAKGFAQSADQILKYVRTYIKKYGLEDDVANGKVKFWIMGYSRGAGVANLAAKRLIEEYSYSADTAHTATGNQVYAYCIASPQGGRNDEMTLPASYYYCIQNCINKVDIVSELGTDEMGFIRYGVDHYVPGVAAGGNVQENTYVWSLVKNESWASSYESWYDNDSWTVGSTEYNAQREKMLYQLGSVDPVNFTFSDYFAIAEQDIIPTSTDALDCDGSQITQEEFIHVILRAIQSWGFYRGYNGDFRDGYSSSFQNGAGVAYPSFESAIQVLVPLYYNLSSEEREGMIESIMYGAEDLMDSVYDYVFNGVKIYNDVIGDWCSLNQEYRDRYLNRFWNYMMCTKHPVSGKAAVDYMTAEQKKSVRAVWDVLLDVVLRFVAGDYKNDVNDWDSSKTPVGGKTVNVAENYASNCENYGSHSLVVLGTILYNTESIAQGHYPEVNFSWLRSYDSFYDNDGNKPLTLETDETPSVEVECSDGIMTLTTDTDGAAVFYRLSSDGTTYGNWLPYNLPVALHADAKYVQTTAIYCGKYSDVETTSITLAAQYSVTVNDVEVGKYSEGSVVTVDGTGTDEQLFKSWDTLENVVTEENKSNAVLTFTMPAAKVELTANYVARITSVALTVAAPQACNELPTTGELSWTVDDTTKTKTIPIYWLEHTGDETQPAGGTAKYGTKYSVGALIEQDLSSDLAFSFDISAATTTVTYGDNPASAADTAYTDASGSLCILGGQLVTDKAMITNVPTGTTVALAGEPTLDDLKTALPTGVTVTLSDGTQTVLALNVEQANTTDAMDGDKVKNGGTVSIPIVGTDSVNADGKSLVVTVTVTNAAVVPPTAETIDAQTSSTTVKLTSADNATIYYTLDGGAKTEYSSPVTMVCEKGVKKTFVITAWAEKDGSRSSDVTYTYTIDNPFTVTIHGKDTGLKGEITGKELWETPKTYKYYNGDSVTIVAPTEADELFEKWDSTATGISITGKETDKTLAVDSISGDIELTAVYNPVIKKLELEMDAPEFGKTLTEQLSFAGVTVTDTYPMTEYFKSIEWQPADTVAARDTVYTAKLSLDADKIVNAAKDQGYEQGSREMLKYFLSEDLEMVVNKNAAGIKASVAKTNDAIYVTFPATTAQSSGFGTLESIRSFVPTVVTYSDAQAGKWGLPKEATLCLTNGGTTGAPVTWAEPVFDSSKRSYSVTGAVTLPDTVSNPNDISTAVSINVLVAMPEDDGLVAEPQATVPSGSYSEKQYVRLSCTTEGSEIYYSLDGNDPTISSTLYQQSTAITISSSATLKAIAIKDGTSSSVMTCTYTISPAPTPTPSDDSASKAADNDAKSPQTGDGSNISLWFAMICISYCGILILRKGKRKSSR